MMSTPYNEVLRNLEPAFHEVLSLIQHERLFINETIRYAAPFTRTGTGLDRWGFLAFTSQRYFEAYYLTVVTRGIWYKKSGFAINRRSSQQNRRWILPPERLPPMSKREQLIDDYAYTTIKGVGTNSFSVLDGGVTLELTELRLEFFDRYNTGYMVLESAHGVHIAHLFQLAIEHGGKIPENRA